jgi:hypothetical protein
MDPHINRRHFLRAGGAFALVTLVPACSSSSDDANDAAPSAPPGPAMLPKTGPALPSFPAGATTSTSSGPASSKSSSESAQRTSEGASPSRKQAATGLVSPSQASCPATASASSRTVFSPSFGPKRMKRYAFSRKSGWYFLISVSRSAGEYFGSVCLRRVSRVLWTICWSW